MEYDQPDLPRKDVIGRVIIEIRQTAERNDDAEMDWTTSYVVLDSGLSFNPPGPWADGLCIEPVPPDAARLNDLPHVYGHSIVAVLKPHPGEYEEYESVFILLDNGYMLTEVMGDWHGTDSTGIYIHSPGEIDLTRLRSIWD